MAKFIPDEKLHIFSYCSNENSLIITSVIVADVESRTDFGIVSDAIDGGNAIVSFESKNEAIDAAIEYFESLRD